MCSNCPAGTYATGTGNNTCMSCAAGTFAGASSAACTACAAGSFSGARATTCTPCEAGTFAQSMGATGCGSCAPGTQQPNAGATECLLCDRDTFANQAGAAACTACGDCNDGTICTDDRCDSVAGCVHDPRANCDASDAGADTPDAADDGRNIIVSTAGCASPPGTGSAETWIFYPLALAGAAFLRARRRRTTMAR